MDQPQPKHIDVHTHLIALGTKENGAHIDAERQNSFLFKYRMHALGMEIGKDSPEKINEIYKSRLTEWLRSSERVEKAVLLAMDGAYNSKGELDIHDSHIYIPNDLVLAAANENPDVFLAGPSINPARADAIEELHRVNNEGAALIKVLPNSQGFDPGNSHFKKFYDEMARLQMPLLSHIGYEFSLVGKDQSMGDPARLKMALERGVPVIGAHGASYGLVFQEPYYKPFLQMLKDFPNLYADVSALTLHNRFGMMLRLARHPEIHNRLFFGTDFPLEVYSFSAIFAGLGALWTASRTKNPFDRQAKMMDSFGFKLGNFRDLLGKIRRP